MGGFVSRKALSSLGLLLGVGIWLGGDDSGARPLPATFAALAKGLSVSAAASAAPTLPAPTLTFPGLQSAADRILGEMDLPYAAIVAVRVPDAHILTMAAHSSAEPNLSPEDLLL